MRKKRLRALALAVAFCTVLSLPIMVNQVESTGDAKHAGTLQDATEVAPERNATPILADTLSATEYQITASAAHEMVPRLGNDGHTDIVVYTARVVLASGALGLGDIWYQRFEQGALIGPPKQVTSDSRHDVLPDICGDYIIYSSYDNTQTPNGQIMVYQISTGSWQVLGDAASLHEGRIHGRLVVWREGGPQATQIMLYDLAWLGQAYDPVHLAGPTPTTYNVEIGDRYVVWSECENGEYDIVAYDLENALRIQVTSTTDEHESRPTTDGPWIVWQAQYSDDLNTRIKALNTDTGEYRLVANDGSGNFRPSISGDIIAYESNVGGDRDIYVYSLTTGETHQLTTNSDDQYLNNIFDKMVAYVDFRFGSEDVFVSCFELFPDYPIFIDPIYIDDNNDFGTLGFPGEGTEDEPYIIENFAVTDSTADLIHIQGTTAHFVIRRCVLDGMHSWVPPYPVPWYSGILLSNVQNGEIVDNDITGCWIGIRILDSSDITISENYLFDNDRMDLYLLRSPNNALQGNVADDFTLEYSMHNQLLRNLALVDGITLVYSDQNILTENTAQNSWRGFRLFGSSDNTLANNIVQNCERGIFLLQSERNNLEGCGIDGCIEGIWVEESPQTTINGLGGSSKITVSPYPGESTGIFLYESDYVTVHDYWIMGFDTGIDIQDCTGGLITVNHIRDNGVAVSLAGTRQTTIERNILSTNRLGVSLTESSALNSIYLNLFMNNDQQVRYNGLNTWSFRLLGNFWSNYWGDDLNGDGVGDTALPHERVDRYPLMDPSIPMGYSGLPVGDDWWQYTTWLIWRGGWSPVDIQVTDQQGQVISRDLNEIGLNAWYIEDDQWEPGTTMVMAMIAVGPMSPYETQQYTFEMTALEALDYSMEWFVSYGDVVNEIGGEVVFRESVENVPLTAGETRLVELEIVQNPDGSVAVPEYTFSGVLHPINADGTSVFKRGRTVPVKFQLFDDAGLPVGVAHATIEVAKISDVVVGEIEEIISSSAADTDNVFRYDSEAEQYIYNLSTKGLETGTYVITIILDDGQVFEVQFSLR